MKNLILAIVSILSVNAFAGAALTQDNIQGEYVLAAKDIFMVSKVILKVGKANIVLRNYEGDISCDGTYNFNEDSQVLSTKFPGCLGSTLAHEVDLKNQTIEKLKLNSKVLVTITAKGQTVSDLPFTIQRTN